MTKQFAVLGHPVAHSKSPVMQNAAFAALSLPWIYDFADCPTQEDAHELLQSGDWCGLNITMPYKPLALSFADESSLEAKLAGGANVLVRTGDGLRADNTDGRGCVAYLQREGVDFAGASAVVCGTGPTSLSILHAVASAGATKVYLAGRNGDKAKSALAGYESMANASHSTKCALLAGSYESGEEAIANADVIIDATPLGMKPGDPSPFNTALLHSGQAVFDVVYGHGETTLLAAAKSAGCETFNGAGMLVAQAVESVYDFCDWLRPKGQNGELVNPRNFDLFAIMASAAGFSL